MIVARICVSVVDVKQRLLWNCELGSVVDSTLSREVIVTLLKPALVHSYLSYPPKAIYPLVVGTDSTV
jgi:hypothetical protein